MELGKDNSSSVILEGYDYRSSTSDLLENTMHVKSLDNDYIFRIPARGSWIQVIGVTPGQIITEKRILQAKSYDGFAVADPRRDIAKLAVIERHHKTGNVGLGFVQGLGIEKGAIVSSVAHDSHNLVVAGMSDSDMLVAARYICSIGGGLAVAYNGQIIANLSLPIAGLMSDKPIELVIANLKTVNEACKILGNNVIRDLFMLLSFLTLSVIPSLKLTDKGLLDIEKFQLTNLWYNISCYCECCSVSLSIVERRITNCRLCVILNTMQLSTPTKEVIVHVEENLRQLAAALAQQIDR